ncbi:MAG TPA: hypothetical protein DD738_06825 [Ruminiclostridium sp.]|nr:hypothetical protein [Ruminiclostridium sp.]
MKRFFVSVLSVFFVLLLTVPAWAAEGGDDGGFSLGEFLLSGLEALFIPRDDFMENWHEDISQRFDDKFGGVRGGLGYLSERFQSLREYRGVDNIFTVAFPRGSFLYGIRMNLLEPAKDVLGWIRFCMTGVSVIATAVFSFHRVRKMMAK